jgi:tetratricopeptide (TPR) repeat protein
MKMPDPIQSNQRGFFRRLGATRNLLLAKTAPGSDLLPGKRAPDAISDRLKKSFPENAVGSSFENRITTMMNNALSFGALAVQVDRLSSPDGGVDDARAEKIFVDTAVPIEDICHREKGIWGILNKGIFGCFFSEKGVTTALRIAEDIQKDIKSRCQETATIGVAVYPTLNFKKGQIIENALKALEHARFFGPHSKAAFDSVTLNISGDQLYDQGDVEGAINEFKLALLLDPSNINVHNSLGVCYGVLGQLNQAGDEFKNALGIDPDETMALYNMGLVEMLKGHQKEAMDFFNQAQAVGEESFELLFQKGRLFLQLKAYRDGLRELRKAVEVNDKHGPAFRFLGECYFHLDRIDEAISAFQKALTLTPNDAESLSTLGWLFHLQGENADIAITLCEQSVDIVPGNGLYRQRLGKLYHNKNRLEDALSQFEKAHELGTDCKKLIKKIKGQQPS